MRQLLLIIVVPLVFSVTQGQVSTKNILTSEHINVKGTKISLIPPKGFISATNFRGFEQTQSGSSIIILDMPGPISETSKGITKERLLSQGIRLNEIDTFSLNNLTAIMAMGEQNAFGNTYTKHILVFGNEKETIMINGSSPKNMDEVSKQIKSAMLTTYYDADKKIDPFETIDFTVDASSGKLTFAKSMSNAIMYTNDGKFPAQSTGKTLLLITKSISTVSIADKKQFALNRFKQLPVAITSIDSISEISVDGISGYEIIASGKNKKTEEAEKMYQVILYSENLYYLFYGSTNHDFENNVKSLRSVVRTFKRK
jgi:hypothetical protein